MTDESTKVERDTESQKVPAKQREQPGGNDAVCFTSGLKGAAFGAGVIHAWLASDRLPPLVAAGISTGAISAAALQRCYRELEGAAPDSLSLERSRWDWFRRYLDSVTNNPLSFIWRAIPDPVDFFADSVPVKDLSAESLPFDLPREETKARRHYYVLTKLGIWLAGFPVRIGTLASIAIYWVRWKEGYGVKWLNPAACAWNLFKALAGLWWHILRSPRFLSEWSFEKRGYRPLFGWLVWIGSMAPILAPALLIVAVAFMGVPWRTAAVGLVVVLVLAAAGLLFHLVVKAAPDPGRKWSLKTVGWEMGRHLFKALDIERGLLSQFELKRGLAELFEKQTLDPALNKDGPRMHLLIVCAALQQSRQIWPAESVSVVEALSAATAIPGIFPPVCKPKSELKNYTGKADKADVVDGAAVRNNPIPAFFEWCNLDDGNRAVAQALERADQPSLHVIYNVPIDRPGSIADAPPPKSIDIVESALASLELEKRRDTRQEVRQTNFISGLEKFRRKAVGDSKPERVSFQIFADEIAPEQEIGFHNEWEPSRKESLKAAAGGCRAAMETLYRREIKEAKGEAGSLSCIELLRKIAPGRGDYFKFGTSGLPEVCASCGGVLQHRATRKEGAPPPGAIRSYGEKGNTDLQELPKGFAHLQGDEPRIVFLGSGGVFRGAFHIGVIGAMQAARVFPDLVVGASVGALMGGALAAITVAPENREAHLLEQLASVFLAVDKRVALTRTFKNATKQLGVRARGLSIAPSELRRMVRSGSKADAGYAATGAPPALIDAIAQLFTIPHRRTTEIASEFIAGHFTNATHCFLKELRQETLSSFEIERFLIGISLLKEQAESLLGKDVTGVHPDEVQPYHSRPEENGMNVSFFCTTSFLNARTSLLLGRDFLTEDPTWDFIFAALSSSAFPAVFSPRSEAEVLPGRGRTDRLFADGGMFDNLPFFPAIEILGAGQTKWRQDQNDVQPVLLRLKKRAQKHDIIIAAGLDAEPGDESVYDTLFKISSRAKSLSVDSKVQTFKAGAEKVKKTLEQIAGAAQFPCSDTDAGFLDSTVNAAILNIVPTDKDHINPTFAFCRSVGLDELTVQKSIADGCFRSLTAFVTSYASNRIPNAPDTTVQAAFEKTKVPELRVIVGGKPGPKECQYFDLTNTPLMCPFAAAKKDEKVSGIRDVCAKDEAHQ